MFGPFAGLYSNSKTLQGFSETEFVSSTFRQLSFPFISVPYENYVA